MAKLFESIDYILIAKDRLSVPSQLKPPTTSEEDGESTGKRWILIPNN